MGSSNSKSSSSPSLEQLYNELYVRRGQWEAEQARLAREADDQKAEKEAELIKEFLARAFRNGETCYTATMTPTYPTEHAEHESFLRGLHKLKEKELGVSYTMFEKSVDIPHGEATEYNYRICFTKFA